MAKGKNGGYRPGGGRPKGSKGRATILRETKRAEVIAAMVDSGKPLAVTVLQKAMEFAEGAVANYRPTTKKEIEAGNQKNPEGNHEEFGKWFDRWYKCISTMAEYQTPKMRAMDAPTPPPDPGTNTKRFTLTVFEGGRKVPSANNDEDAA